MPPAFRIPLTARQKRQLALATLVAIALFVLARKLPTGANLSHLDFRPPGNGASALQFCDPSNPSFLPVATVPSPVTLTLLGDRAPEQNHPVNFTFILRTASGKAVGPDDLALTHTKLLHLLVIDPSLGDYQHLHPEPGATPGEWRFSMTPRRTGKYLVFADFTPVATGLGLYASADFIVPGAPAPPMRGGGLAVARDGYRYTLASAKPSVRAGEIADLTFTVVRTDGRPVPLGQVMGAYAHLVAFDEARTGFAHLHPDITDPKWKPDPQTPRLAFKVQLPKSGRYMVWAQLNLAGRDELVPFELAVLP